MSTPFHFTPQVVLIGIHIVFLCTHSGVSFQEPLCSWADQCLTPTPELQRQFVMLFPRVAAGAFSFGTSSLLNSSCSGLKSEHHAVCYHFAKAGFVFQKIGYRDQAAIHLLQYPVSRLAKAMIILGKYNHRIMGLEGTIMGLEGITKPGNPIPCNLQKRMT